MLSPTPFESDAEKPPYSCERGIVGSGVDGLAAVNGCNVYKDPVFAVSGSAASKSGVFWLSFQIITSEDE